ncbi:MAG: hypothetical protein KDI88_06220 [Gammaproteobacteria bacterium]|nr:hypothetical protein [Gammaproteobacteria bacterium]
MIWSAALPAAEPLEERSALRDCISAARETGAIAACEAAAQTDLRGRIERWTRAIRVLLDNRQRPAFDRSVDAWQAWFESETHLLELTLAQRRDGLGPRLQSGAVTRLFEDRERQLREHLHNLKFAGPRR